MNIQKYTSVSSGELHLFQILIIKVCLVLQEIFHNDMMPILLDYKCTMSPEIRMRFMTNIRLSSDLLISTVG